MSASIYTRWGDSGETSLVGGVRVHKDSARVSAYGTLDEALAHLGMARAAIGPNDTTSAGGISSLDEILAFVQQRVFNCSSNLATPPDPSASHTPRVSAEDIAALERWIDRMTEHAGAFPGFIVPGGCELSARLHVARTVVRRAEREIVALANLEPVDPTILAFVNRLSDLLFAAARVANLNAGVTDVLWDPKATTPRD